MGKMERSAHHFIAIALALPVFGISMWTALDDPAQLNPWHRPSGVLDLNLWYLVLPQLVCSVGIILTEAIAFLASRKRGGASGPHLNL